MKKNPTIFGVAIICIGLLIYFFINQGEEETSWFESYKKESKEPYGTLLIASLLNGFFPEKNYTEIDEPLETYLAENSFDEATNYVFIGRSMYLSDSSQKELLSFVEKGNNAMIISTALPQLMFDTLFSYDDIYEPNYDYLYDNEIKLTFKHPNLMDSVFAVNYYYDFDTTSTYWSYHNRDVYTPKIEMVELGILNRGLSYFVKIKWGEGYFYLHTVPLAFSNYLLKKEKGFSHAQTVFSNLPEGDILWDEVSKIYVEPPFEQEFSPSPLKFILSHESLRWAWYLLLALVVFYVLFRSKRTQRIIPILDPYLNTSLEFVQTVGKLHFKQLDHKGLAQEKMQLFLGDIRRKYRVSTNNLDDAFIKSLSVKAQVELEIVQKVFATFETINNFYKVGEEDLKRLYLSIETFNKHANSTKLKPAEQVAK
ncbi:hypothetical protein R9C00_13380 [Flammeovirgaceae bacterium SG7u.111]|nr:hypothetical protein [Flammeovirgaceae bacterium SG7u.132]WPO38449.1 hypothetical protein R9C00_13380 [Flammeovirgaceae bacterium SG7u.111]